MAAINIPACERWDQGFLISEANGKKWVAFAHSPTRNRVMETARARGHDVEPFTDHEGNPAYRVVER